MSQALAATPADGARWVVRGGLYGVSPKAHPGSLLGLPMAIDSTATPVASLEYLLTPHWDVEAVVGWPTHHDVSLGGMTAIRTRPMAPIVEVNYRFLPGAVVSPVVGVGANYTVFVDTQGLGPAAGQNVQIDHSWGVVAHAGFDFRISQHWLVTAEGRWIDMHSAVRLNGAKLGVADISPWVYGLSLGYRF